MTRKDALAVRSPSRRETHTNWLPLQLSDLQATIVIDAGDHLDHKASDAIARIGKVMVDPDAYKLIMEMSKTFYRAGRKIRVHVKDFYDKPEIVGVGFKWAQDLKFTYESKDFMVMCGGSLMILDHQYGNYPQWALTDSKTFLSHFKQYVEDPNYALGQTAGHARDITRLIINIQEAKN